MTSVHRIPRPTFVTIGQTPLLIGRETGGACRDDLPGGRSGKFFLKRLDRGIKSDRTTRVCRSSDGLWRIKDDLRFINIRVDPLARGRADHVKRKTLRNQRVYA